MTEKALLPHPPSNFLADRILTLSSIPVPFVSSGIIQTQAVINSFAPLVLDTRTRTTCRASDMCYIYFPLPRFLFSSISVSRLPSNFHSPSLSSFYRSLFLDCPVIFAVPIKLNIPKRESARKGGKNIECQNQLFFILSLSLPRLISRLLK